MLLVKVGRRPALVITREALLDERLVYVALANRMFKYPRGRSCIAYIGTTKRGVRRVASSAAHKAPEVLRDWGMRSLQLHIVTCTARPGTPAWRRLERALIVTFKQEYGSVPKGNRQGKNFEAYDEYKYFKPSRLRSVLKHYERPLR